MSSLPSEVLEDVLQPLDRWTLDAAEFTNRRFLQLTMERMSDVCLRLIHEATFKVSYKENGLLNIRIDRRPKRKIYRKSEDVAQLFVEFLQALLSSRVRYLTLESASSKGFVFTATMATLTLETPIIAHELIFTRGSYAELTPTEFRELILHFSPTSVQLERCDLRPDQVSDDFLRALFKNGVLKTWIESALPAQDEPDRYHVTDDAVVDFVALEDDQQGEVASPRSWRPELALHNGSFTKGLFKRLVEASDASTRERPLRIRVSPVRFEDGDLPDFEEHLTYSRRGTWSEERIYDFPGEMPLPAMGPGDEVPTEMHLQIVLNAEEEILELQRARLPYRLRMGKCR